MNFTWNQNGQHGQSAAPVGQAELKKPLFSKPPKTQPIGRASAAQTVALPAANPFAAALDRARAERQQRLNTESRTAASPAGIPPVTSVGQVNPAQFISGGKLRRIRSNTHRNTRKHRRRHTRRHKRRNTRGCKHNKRRSRR